FVLTCVARREAVSFVDSFKAVQGQCEYRQRRPTALRAQDFCCQAFLGKTTVIEARQRIDQRQSTQQLGMSLFFGQLSAQPFDERLLVDYIEVENDDQRHQAKNGVAR